MSTKSVTRPGPTVEVREEPTSALPEYAGVPIAFRVDRAFDVTGDCGGFSLAERVIETPYTKDYDAVESPLDWPVRFDLSNWGLLAALEGGRRVGGAAVTYDSRDLDMMEGRRDLAVLWDIRVAPDARGQGVGSALFRAAEAWAKSRGCRHLKCETQNINVPACKFYLRQGCTLGTIHRLAYPAFPDEIQFLWYKEL